MIFRLLRYRITLRFHKVLSLQFSILAIFWSFQMALLSKNWIASTVLKLFLVTSRMIIYFRALWHPIRLRISVIWCTFAQFAFLFTFLFKFFEWLEIFCFEFILLISIRFLIMRQVYLALVFLSALLSQVKPRFHEGALLISRENAWIRSFTRFQRCRRCSQRTPHAFYWFTYSCGSAIIRLWPLLQCLISTNHIPFLEWSGCFEASQIASHALWFILVVLAWLDRALAGGVIT